MKYLPLFIFLVISLTTRGEEFTLDPISPGEKRLGITLHEFGKDPDLSEISVEGYQVENAVLIQENDSALPLKTYKNVIDISADSAIQILHYQPQQNLMIVESPSHFIWEAGIVITDTSFQGFSQKVLQILELKRSFSSIQWQLKVEPASLLDIVIQCDISFTSKPKLLFALPDTQWSVQVTGTENNSLKPVKTKISILLENLALEISPLIKGRLRIFNNRIEIFQFDVDGPYKINGSLTLSNFQKGKFFYNAQLPFQTLHTFPIGGGLNVQLHHSVQLKINSELRKDNFQTRASLTNSSEIHLSLSYERGQWLSRNPLLDLSTSSSESQEQPLPRSSGVLKCSIIPNLRMLWGGESGLSLTLEAYTQIFHLVNYLGSFNRIIKYGIVSSAVPVSAPDLLLEEMAEIHIGIQEKVSMSPPVTPIQAVLADTASDSLVFDWPHIPNTENYIIQMNIGAEFKSIDTVAAPPFVASQLFPDVTYIFRIIPINKMGVGIPSVVAGKTRKLNFPPSDPLPVYPLPNTKLPDSAISLKWRAEDPDSTDALRYSLFLDTVPIPVTCVLRGEPDSTFSFPNPLPGGHYYWRVEANDGVHTVMGPVWQFRVVGSPRVSGSVQNNRVCEDVRVKIPGGSFEREDGRLIEINSFKMNKCEVTQKEFRQVMGYNPSFWQGELLPVENVNWNEAIQYCREIGGRLPTEAEWEYAARAGTNSAFYWGAGNAIDFAWFYANSEKQTHPVGKKKPNKWGLHDMSGNVFEWVADWHSKFYKADSEVPSGDQIGNARVTRGGSWFSDLSSLKSGSRFKNRPAFSSYKLGFRCAFPLSTAEK